MHLALGWWEISHGGSQQAVRGNVKALKEAGHDVDLYLGPEMQQLEQRTGEYDVVVLPFIHYDGIWEAFEDTHVHLQLGGFPAQPNPAATQKAIEYADTVSALDPSIVGFYQQQISVDSSEIALIPNAPNRDLFDRQPLDTSDGHALVVKLGSANKGATELEQVANHAPEQSFEVHYTGKDAPSLPDCVTMRPPVPFSEMPQRYAQARAVLNPSSRDVLPNTFFEAILSGRPYLCRGTAIGHIQSVPADTLETDHWGRSVDWWNDAVGPAVGGGRHFIACDSAEELGTSASMLLDDDNSDAREELITAADEWLESWGGWDWESKGHALTAVILNKGPVTKSTKATV